ncbi:MAG: ATP phosphoribosyltransferase [Kofleriaceae bacterium]|nr:ATP phosphoribosyltransferase [Kofleriaceae bacterium]
MTIRLSLQKSGRLSRLSYDLLTKCGVSASDGPEGDGRLIGSAIDFPLEFLRVRDDDIPEYVHDGVSTLGIVGENVLWERGFGREGGPEVKVLRKLGFARCRLAIALPKEELQGQAKAVWRLEALNGKRIATTYPEVLRDFAKRKELDIEIVYIRGAVEIAPGLGVADAVCDLVSTGSTLKANGLAEAYTVFESEAVLIQTEKPVASTDEELVNRLLQRIDGVQRANRSRYIMMNAPSEAVEEIRAILPGLQGPTIIPIDPSNVAIHAVASEDVFWETIERLKSVGANSILVSPIEKLIA